MRGTRTLILLFTILLIGLILRFYKLGDFPSGFHRDEAFLGYNAYSILKTGKDMSGNLLPLHLQSFIYSPAVYSYLSIPFIRLFDLNIFSVRFASAFFGSLTVILTFFLVKELFRNNNNKTRISLLSSFLIAISPWHINLSRTATENTVVVFFIGLGTLCFLLWVRKEFLYLLLLSFFSFGLTLFIYQAPRAFLPFFIPLLIICFLGRKIKKGKIISAGALFLLVIMIPLFLILSSKSLSLRIRTVSVLAGSETKLVLNQQIREDGVEKTNSLLTRFFHNKLVGYSGVILENYFSHFSYNFLFTDKGLPDRYRVPLVGLLYLLELPIFILGTLYLMQESKKRIGIFLIGWIMLTPVGSALTFDDIPNLQRTLLVFPALSIISSFGFFHLILKVKRKVLRKILILVFSTFLIFYFSFYIHQYYVHANKYRPWYRQDGYRELVEKINELLPRYKKIVITDRESAPTIFFLFFNNYGPERFQKEKQLNVFDYDRINFGKYEFSQEECPARIEKDRLFGEKGVLYVNSGLCKVMGSPIKEVAVIKRKDNSTVFRMVEIK